GSAPGRDRNAGAGRAGRHRRGRTRRRRREGWVECQLRRGGPGLGGCWVPLFAGPKPERPRAGTRRWSPLTCAAVLPSSLRIPKLLPAGRSRLARPQYTLLKQRLMQIGAPMILAIADALTTAEVAEARASLASATFHDGRPTAGWSAKLVKANLQAAESPLLQSLRQFVQARLLEHAVFALAARPKTILGPLFSRYEPGHAYGSHVDDALIGGVRTDVSFTLFLTAPD